MTTKQITFNLSSLSSSHKTKKHREIKNKPIISPNVLKNKLLKRIKDHKKKEQNETTSSNKSNTEKTDILAYTDEFNDSIDYLQNLSKQSQIEQKREQLYRQTLKHPTSTSTSTSTSIVQVYNELPDELKPVTIIPSSLNISPTIQLNHPDTLPYGILKNGTKPTFREWQKTQKNISLPSHHTNELSERERKLADLKDKIRKQSPSFISPSNIHSITPSHIPQITIPQINTNPQINTTPQINTNPQIITTPQINTNPQIINQVMHPEIIIPQQIEYTSGPIMKPIPGPKMTKYTLGKINKTVGVLLKDNKTRKNIMNAQTNLRQKNIQQIKEYLKDHNLIKVGSSAPTDVLRKMFESAMLTGEITNSNKDILLHNFMKSD